MTHFEGKTAVITGAGSGIGRSLAHAAAAKGMKVVLADINEADLRTVQGELASQGAKTHAKRVNVSSAEEVRALADEAREVFGNVHLLVNNAGVGAPPERLWETTLKDWEWVLGVNLRGVIHGVHAFVPAMLEHGEDAHIVNTASIAGLISNSRLNAYGVSKHAVVALSETLHLDLQEVGAKVGVSVLCPAWVKTRINEAQRNRPAAEQVNMDALAPTTKQAVAAVQHAADTGLAPDLIARLTFEAVEQNIFYILTHPPYETFIQNRLETILSKQAPTPNQG